MIWALLGLVVLVWDCPGTKAGLQQKGLRAVTLSQLSQLAAATRAASSEGAPTRGPVHPVMANTWRFARNRFPAHISMPTILFPAKKRSHQQCQHIFSWGQAILWSHTMTSDLSMGTSLKARKRLGPSESQRSRSLSAFFGTNVTMARGLFFLVDIFGPPLLGHFFFNVFFYFCFKTGKTLRLGWSMPGPFTLAWPFPLFRPHVARREGSGLSSICVQNGGWRSSSLFADQLKSNIDHQPSVLFRTIIDLIKSSTSHL